MTKAIFVVKKSGDNSKIEALILNSCFFVTDHSDTKSKRRGGYLLKKRVLRKEKEKEPSNKRDSGVQQPVFGIPLSQCVELSTSAAAATAAANAALRKPSTASEVLADPDLLSSSLGGGFMYMQGRSESRNSMGSLAGGAIDRVSLESGHVKTVSNFSESTF